MVGCGPSSIQHGTTFCETCGLRNGSSRLSRTSAWRSKASPPSNARHAWIATTFFSSSPQAYLSLGLSWKASERIRRPVLFGSNGYAEVSYEIDASHDGHGIVVEVEAGRGARGNATYRDIIRTSLIVEPLYLVRLLPVACRHDSDGREVTVRAYKEYADPRVSTLRQPATPTAFSRSTASWLLQ